MGEKNAQESECTRGSSMVLFAPEELGSGTRGSSLGFKADDLYCVVCCSAFVETPSNQRERGKTKEKKILLSKPFPQWLSLRGTVPFFIFKLYVPQADRKCWATTCDGVGRRRRRWCCWWGGAMHPNVNLRCNVFEKSIFSKRVSLSRTQTHASTHPHMHRRTTYPMVTDLTCFHWSSSIIIQERGENMTTNQAVLAACSHEWAAWEQRRQCSFFAAN